MDFVKVGTVDSHTEFHSVWENLDKERMYQAVELLGSLANIESKAQAKPCDGSQSTRSLP
jgi:hypothetical protein